MTLWQALERTLSTWPIDQTPKIHFSSPRTSMIAIEQKDKSGHKRRILRQPRLSQHADLIDPFAFIQFLRSVQTNRDFDVMLECKAQDVALLRLRRQLCRLAPDLVARHKMT
jgi:UV DNA damage endonuclease